MADIVEPCNECGRIYNQTKLKACPGCARMEISNYGVGQSTGHSSPKSRSASATTTRDLSESGEVLNELLDEMRASRQASQQLVGGLGSLAMFLFTTIVFGLISMVLYALAVLFGSSDYPNPIMLTIAFIVALTGFAISLVALWNAMIAPNRAGR